MSTTRSTTRPTTTAATKKPPKKATRRRNEPRRGNDRVTATSGKLTFTIDDRPHLEQLNLPGPRRELEGRGGATPALDVMRYLIRCPLLPALTAAIAPRGGRPSAYPDIFWVFVLAATREFGKNDHLLQELKSNWPEIAKEFYFEHNVALPHQRGIAYASLNSWRTNAIIDKTHQLNVLLERLTQISVPLALAIRRAEGGDEPRDLLNPTVWDCVAADGTVRRAPSDVSAELGLDNHGKEVIDYHGSRAKTGLPRVHEAVSRVNKHSGPSDGLFNVVATTKGVATYTRTVLGVEIGHAGEGETPIAMRALHRVYSHLGNQLPTLLYDGALTPISWQELVDQYGVFCVNANYARKAGTTGKGRGESGAKDFDPDSTTTGEGSRKYGRRKNTKKATFVTDLTKARCNNGPGGEHVHHIAADDGAVFETHAPVLIGLPADRIQTITPSRAERLQDSKGRFHFCLHFKAECARGGGHFTFTQNVEWTEPDKAGHVSWRSVIANVRIIPEIAEQFPRIYGGRNQIEAFFDWFEQCFYRRDRAASWGREAQIIDLVAASLLHNAEAWAHLAYRHPDDAEALTAELRSLPTPDLTVVKRKPKEETKAAQNARLHQPMETTAAAPEVPAETEEVDGAAA